MSNNDERGRGDNTTPTDSRSESYNGWANRETWAVALHINNDQGWQESVHEALREATSELPPTEDGQPPRARLTDYEAGEIIRENVESAFDWEFFAGIPVPRDLLNAREDIGSLWRVDWTELGAAFLSDLDELER